MSPQPRRNFSRVPRGCSCRIPGVHGPFTTGQFLEAVQNGHIRPKTVIRLLQSPEWVAADQIDGLGSTSQCDRDSRRRASSIRSVVTPATPNAQMRHLFAECVSRQRASQPIHPGRSSQSARDGDRKWWASSIGFVTSLVATLIESVVVLGVRFVRSRLVWGLSGLLLATFLFSRFSPHLTTQETKHLRRVRATAGPIRRRSRVDRVSSECFEGSGRTGTSAGTEGRLRR